MAFNFDLDFGDIIDAGKAVAGIVGMFDEQKAPKSTRQALDQNQGIAAALMNPDDPMFQRLAAEHEARINRDFATGLRQLMTMDRRARARGVGMLNPERRDEAIAQASARGRADAGAKGRDAARAYLTNAAAVNNAAFSATAPLMQLDASNRQNFYGGLEAAFDLARGGYDRLNGDPAQTPSLTLNMNQMGSRNALPSLYRS
jgi:hypothetical protein